VHEKSGADIDELGENQKLTEEKLYILVNTVDRDHSKQDKVLSANMTRLNSSKPAGSRSHLQANMQNALHDCGSGVKFGSSTARMQI